MNNKKINKNNIFIISIIVLFVTIISQAMIVPALSAKYFYDSDSVLSIANNGTSSYSDDSFNFAGNFFRFINIFKYDTFQQWAITLSIIGSIIAVIYFCKYCKRLSFLNLIFIIYVTIFLNIYVFRIGKDFIQWIIWLLVLLSMNDKNSKRRIVLLIALFILEAVLFRGYYLAIIIVFVILTRIMERSKHKKNNTIKIILLCIVGAILALLLIQKINPSIYERIINVREYTNEGRIGSVDASSMINDIIRTDNLFLNLINMIINLTRVLFPVELLMKSTKYIPFVVFQVYLSLKTIQALMWHRNDNRLLSEATMMFFSFLIVSSVFEPDYGSVMRHEIACMPIFLITIFSEDNKKEKCRDESTN